MFSYWEQQSFSHYDHIIVGAGIVGLNVAIALKELYPLERVLVLERGLLPTGASTRNAGFACMGSVTELLDNLQVMDEAAVVALFAMRKRGLERLRNRLGDEAIGYKSNGSYEVIREESSALDKIDYLNDLLQPITHRPAFRIASDKIDEFGFAREYVKALVACTCEGELHSGKLLRTLSDYAMMHGIEIKTGAEVLRFEEHTDNVQVVVRDPFRAEEWQLTCNTFTICTNAFTKQLLPDADVVPGRGQIIITDPIPDLKFKGIYHMDKGYYYFREIDGRVLLGGGRNLDFEGETTTEFSLSEHIQNDLEQKLSDIILPGTPFTIAQRWAGIMAFGKEKMPVVKSFSKHVYGAFRMSGMGVALASEVAAQLAQITQEHR